MSSSEGDDTQSVSRSIDPDRDRPLERERSREPHREKVTGGANAPLEPTRTEDLPRGTAIGRYLVVHRLGAGGMGVVYAAYDAELDRKVALKLLRPKAAGGSAGHARLLREAQAMARVSHPNVIAIHDVGTFGDQVFMAMDLVEGSTLAKWVKEKNRTWQEIARALLDAGNGLAAAHAAGLVHRDFKPQNVLVRRDGRVFVTDFGLARMAATEDDAETNAVPTEERELERRSRLTSNLTGHGVVLGTPKYMAPEQHLAGSVDARADQFSFCASLYWSLWKTPAFDPGELARRADRMRTQTSATTPLKSSGPHSDGTVLLIREPPSQPRVPARLRRAVMRGLALDPAQRFPGMEPLLAEILAVLHPPSMQVAMAAAALAVVVVAGGSAWAYRDRSKTQLCSGGSAEIASVWNPRVAGAVQGAFAAVAPERGPELSRPLTATLDGYAGRWVQAHREACEATRIRGEQTEAVLSLRMMCLERRRKELAALVRLLERPDTSLVDRSVDAAMALSAVSQCGDTDALAQVGRPEDPARRAALEKLEEQLAGVDALRIAARYSQGLEEARAALSAAQSLAFKPLVAQAHLELGLLLDSTGDQKGASRELQEAIKLAESGRDDVTKTRAASRLGFVIGYRQSQTEPSLGWVHLAEGTLERLGTDRYPELESDVYTVLGLVFLRAGNWREALAGFQRSLAAAEHIPAADLQRARALANIAATLGHLGDREEAVRSGRMAIATFEKLRGRDHPILVEPLQNLTNDLVELGRHAEALAASDRALALTMAKLGPEHPATADVLDSRSSVLLELGRPKEALAASERALALHQKVKGATSAEGFSLDGIGRAQLALGRVPEAIAALERARAVKPPDEQVMAEINFTLARALVAGRRDQVRARALAAEARKGFEELRSARRVAEVDAWLATLDRKRR